MDFLGHLECVSSGGKGSGGGILYVDGAVDADKAEDRIHEAEHEG